MVNSIPCVCNWYPTSSHARWDSSCSCTSIPAILPALITSFLFFTFSFQPFKLEFQMRKSYDIVYIFADWLSLCLARVTCTENSVCDPIWYYHRSQIISKLLMSRQSPSVQSPLDTPQPNIDVFTHINCAWSSLACTFAASLILEESLAVHTFEFFVSRIMSKKEREKRNSKAE